MPTGKGRNSSMFSSGPGIHELVRDFFNLLGPGPVPDPFVSVDPYSERYIDFFKAKKV